MNEKILDNIIDYLKEKIPNFKTKTRGKFTVFTCPKCNKEGETALIIPNTKKIRCTHCNEVWSFTDVIKIVEPMVRDETEYDIVEHVRDTLKLETSTEEELKNALDFYEKNGFDLVPIVRNNKNPIELSWTSKTHKNRKEWEDWLKDGLNIGVKSGKVSNITIVDIDQEEIPQEISDKLPPTLYQKTGKGHHIFFKYCDELKNTRIQELKTDILNDGKQAVIYPSVVDESIREITFNEIAEMPKELLEVLKSKTSIPLKTFSEKVKEEIQSEEINPEELEIKPVEEGNRNSFLIKFGGILRKEMNLSQTSYTLDLINKFFCKPPVTVRELDAIVGQLDRYISFDETDLALNILNYMKIVEEASSRDIQEALGEKGANQKQRLEKAIKYLTKEGFLFKKRRAYHLIKKAEWRTEFLKDSEKIDFIFPYFNDYAIFRNGDITIIGAKSGTGKTILAMNMIKRLVEQGKTPYYISLESGSRFLMHASALGLNEGTFKYCTHFKPEDISLEKNAITIIDWLLPDDYSMVDKLYKHFAEEMFKQGGQLIVFTQLMQNGEFFAKNMVDLFASFVCKFLYDDEHGEYSHFQITKVRESASKTRFGKIVCKYDFEKKRLNEISDEEINKSKKIFNED